MRKNLLLLTSVATLSVLALGCAPELDGEAEEGATETVDSVEQAITNSSQITVPWSRGAGDKAWAFCPNGYFAYAIRNVDLSNNAVSNDVLCGRVDDYVPAGTDISHFNCETISVQWTGGAGEKLLAECSPGKFAMGFQITDYANRDETISKMQCCGVRGRGLLHANSVVDPVVWTPGAGPKPWTYCSGEPRLITGIGNRDYGGHNQGVSKIECSSMHF